MKEKRIASIILITLSLLTVLVCAILPLFSFWNYKLYMLFYLTITVLLALLIISKNTEKSKRAVGVVALIVSVGVIVFSGFLNSAMVCSAIGVVISIVLLKKERPQPFAIILTVILSLWLQASSVMRASENYQKAISGLYDLPSYVPGLLQKTMLNEKGMLFIAIALDVALLSI